VEQRAIGIDGSGSLALLPEILLPADGHIGDEHDPGMPIEQRP
jgi:hypothetical protein